MDGIRQLKSKIIMKKICNNIFGCIVFWESIFTRTMDFRSMRE